MTEYRVIGRYQFDATDVEKIDALTATLRDAAMELVALGASMVFVEFALEDARMAAESEVHAG